MPNPLSKIPSAQWLGSRTAVFCLLLLLSTQVLAWGHIASPV
jgi:hypothetical protein